jgi:glutamyl-tRNA synthetase
VLIYEALGEPVPRFAHLPLILAPNKGKLSKRKHGEVVSLTTYRDRGFVPAAFRNFLALLGWSPPDGKEILSKDELMHEFSPRPSVVQTRSSIFKRTIRDIGPTTKRCG